MTSTRTEYRTRRIDMIGKMITSLAGILIFEKRVIERLNLPEIKKVSETIQKWEKQANDFQNILTSSKKPRVMKVKQNTKTDGIKQDDFSEG